MYCFAKICRLCLNHDSALIHCRARDKNNIPNYHKIKILFPQLVNKTSQHFPVWICTKCQEQVNQSYEFKQKCYKNYKLLRKYCLQLFEANKGNNLPDIPTEIFQEVKPIIDNNVICIDEEEHSENYYNADDITIVKNELLPSNFKNEPEFHNMVQQIIDNNFETIRQIDGTKVSISTLNNSDVVANNTNKKSLVSASQADTSSSISCKNIGPEQIYNSINSSTEKSIENNNINPLDAAAFTLDYTNASFETFASHVAPSLNCTSELVLNPNLSSNKEDRSNIFLSDSNRVLRQRKPISYRTIEKCLDDIPSQNMKKRKSSPTKKTYKSRSAVNQKAEKRTQEKINDLMYDVSASSSIDLSLRTLEKNKRKSNSETTKSPIIPNSERTRKVTKKHKQKYGAYFCEKCSKQYVMFSRFHFHVSKCNGIIKHQCTICNKFFSNLGNLRRHSKLHLILKLKATCSLCENQYFTQTALQNHIQARHNLNANKTNPFF